ncbi:hypothetical protein [Lactobacillus ultunensis]|uniref:Uncharacterized protein n=1 Tax=Lactobacillus ultunensis DSM 16047 TaxID=525365 RepID=C2EPB0_9LACO|nr:hypothetical protein [Lactobacillus ultunensis]EEJ71605.1 hypothetical protein HMPREF0548_1506 [Lactobacillus ultunensis DSM 16047]KRL82460.1 hypothetical protein FC57_GL001890 [Lactobacillus ultunensis DSM 16047]QQP28413.1 hypothetical protein H4B44_10030 [Lactobacillus ultunensis]
MNPDFAIVLNFKTTGEFDADFLVKTARNIGARAVMSNNTDGFQAACDKYTIFLADEKDGLNLNSKNVIDTMVENRKNGKSTIINVPVNNGKFDKSTQETLDAINSWMHMFGHAFNEGQPSELTVSNGFILENRHANYQKYVFLKDIPNKITVEGLDKEPNRVEWIEHRTELNFAMKDGKLTIDLVKPDDVFEWNVLRIQAHRPEDDIIHTEF